MGQRLFIAFGEKVTSAADQQSMLFNAFFLFSFNLNQKILPVSLYAVLF